MTEFALQAWPAPWRVAAALAMEALVGYPAWLHFRLPHPVVALGAALSALERRWNRLERPDASRRLLGVAAVLLVAGAAALAGWGAQSVLSGAAGLVAFAVLGSLGLAQRSLYQHVVAVAYPLLAGDLEGAREAVAMIVGRDTADLSADGVAAAAIESLAESFSDGVVAPAFWLLVGGLPGLFAYKAVNTADSMIGHREPRWRAFGWAAARADDLMNLIPARIAGLLIVIAGGGGLRTMIGQAHRHASPNAGWPEAAMAGALDIQLGGPATYDGVLHDRPLFGDGAEPEPEDIGRALGIYIRACLALAALLVAGGFAWPR